MIGWIFDAAIHTLVSQQAVLPHCFSKRLPPTPHLDSSCLFAKGSDAARIGEGDALSLQDLPVIQH